MDNPKDSISETELKDFLEEINKAHEKDRKTYHAVVILNNMIKSIARVLQADTPEALWNPAVADIVMTTMENAAKDGGQTDVLKGTRLLISAALRFSQATVDGMQRRTDLNAESPDDPIVI